MSHDVPFPYRQDVDLSYLCGFQEASSLLACVKPNDAGSERWHLFVRPRKPSEELRSASRAALELDATTCMSHELLVRGTFLCATEEWN